MMSNCSSLVSSLQCKNPSSHEMRELPVDFVLGEHDVFCGRGGRCFNHTGNRRFRSKVMSRLGEYSKAKSKYDKTAIIDEIISEVRCLSPNGGFVRRDVGTGRYFEVGDFLAREKTSQAFRDALQGEYKSCNANRKERRMAGQRNEKDAQSFLSLMKSKNYYLVEKKRNLKCRADCQQTNLNNDEDILGKIASSSLGQDFDNLFFSTSQDKSIDDFINGNSRQTASQNISLSVDDCDILQEVNQLDTQIVFTQTRLCNFPNSLTSINCGLSGLVAMPSLTIQSNDPPKTSPLRPDSERISSAFKNSNSCTFENQLRTEQISSHGCSSKHDGFAYHYGKGPTDEKTFDLLLQFAETHSHQFSNGDNFEPSPI